MSWLRGYDGGGRNQQQKREAKDETSIAGLHANSLEVRGRAAEMLMNPGGKQPGTDGIAKTFSGTRTIQKSHGGEQGKFNIGLRSNLSRMSAVVWLDFSSRILVE